MADVLVVTSKVKKFIREKSTFNTSAELIEASAKRLRNSA